MTLTSVTPNTMRTVSTIMPTFCENFVTIGQKLRPGEVPQQQVSTNTHTYTHTNKPCCSTLLADSEESPSNKRTIGDCGLGDILWLKVNFIWRFWPQDHIEYLIWSLNLTLIWFNLMSNRLKWKKVSFTMTSGNEVIWSWLFRWFSVMNALFQT